MARTKQARRKKNKARSEFALAEIPKRYKDGQKARKVDTVAARKLKPTPEQELRLALLKGAPGSPDDPLAKAKADGLLTDWEHEALHRYRNITEANRRSIHAPSGAVGFLSFLQPSGGEVLTPEEALIRLKQMARDMHDAVRGCKMAEHQRLEMAVSEWGRYFTRYTCELLKEPADRLARHFWPERFVSQKFGEAA